MRLFSLILLAFVPFILCFSGEEENTEWLRLLNLPKPVVSVTTSVCQLNGQTVTDFLTNNQNKGLVLIIKSSAQTNSCGNDFAESSAQLLASNNITVCELSVTEEMGSLFGSAGSVVVVMNGKQHRYYGRRSPSALMSFVLKLSATHVKLITGKLDKMAYDLVPGPKLVGFFMPATPDLAAYEAVALKYSPNIPFYLVADRMVAKHLKLSIVGQINLVKPLEKLAITCTVNPATALDIETFIEQNKGVVLKYVTEENLFDPELKNPNKTTLIAISDRTSVVGQYFYKLLRNTVRNITRENNNILSLLANTTATEPVVIDATANALDTTVPSITNLDVIEILWIDRQTFASINVWLSQIQSLYGLAAGLDVYLGAINAKTNESVWLDTNLFNTTADKSADETNLQLLKDWITTVINNQTVVEPSLTDPTLTAIPTETKIQSFVRQPQSQTVVENTPLVIECVVSGQVGDCLWLKDGQNIGFNLARVSPDYKWKGATGSGDCSLVISSAQAERDSGEWVCEVTGDANNPTITSSPALITVNTVPKIEL